MLILSVPLAWPQTGPLTTGQNPDSAGSQARPLTGPLTTGQNPSPTASQADLPTALGELSKYQGVAVQAIEFRGIKGTNPEMLRQLLAQKTAEPLDRDKIRASLRVLYATDRKSTRLNSSH